MIPKDWVSSTASTQKLYTALDEQLGSNYLVIQYLERNKGLNGSLFWLQHKQQSLFIYLGTSIEPQLNSSSLETLISNTEIKQLLKLQEQLLPKQLNLHKAHLAPLLVIFPSISNLENNISIKSLGLHVLGEAALSTKKLGKLISGLLGQPNSSLTHSHIRHAFNPEIRLSQKTPSSLVAFKDNLLDNEQELAIKADIELPKNNRRINNYNLTGINGGASSGKTETLIQRAKLINQINTNKKILLLSINKASNDALNNRYSKPDKNNNSIEVFSLYQWCNQQLKLSKKLVCIDDTQDFISSIISSQLEEENISLSTFSHEIDFIHSRAIFYKQDYLKAPNLSRPYLLDENQQSHIWKTYLLLKSELSARDWELWSRLPQLLWDSLNDHSNDKLNIVTYDHILVDDAHHFPPIAFEVFKQFLQPKTGQLFITQDSNQGINNPFQLWKDTDLDLKGHNNRLYNYYQIASQILNSANAFYLNRLPDNNDKFIIEDISSNIAPPKLLHFHSMKDQVNRLLNEVKKTIQAGSQLQDILILTPSSKTTKKIAEIIKNSLGKNIQILSRENTFHHQQNSISTCNIIHAKGISASHVYIFDIQEVFAHEEELSPSSVEYKNLIIQNTRLLNMGMSRARKSLTLFITADKIPDSLITPHITIPTANKENNADISYIRKFN